MSDIFDHRVVDMQKIRSLDSRFEVVELTLGNGETIEAPVIFAGGDEEQ